MYSPITNLAGVNAQAFDIIVGTASQINAGNASHTMSNFVAAIANSYRVLILDGDHTLVRSEDITETDVQIYFQTNARILKSAAFTFTISGARVKIYDGQFSGFSTDDLVISGEAAMVVVSDGDESWFNVTGAGSIIISADATDGGVKGDGWKLPREVVTITGTTPTYSMGDEDLLIVNTNVEPWDLSTISYDALSTSVSTENGSPKGIFFKSDGTTMYMVGSSGSNDEVYQYTLETAWDISTLLFDSNLININSETTVPSGLFFKPDGTEMYITNASGSALGVYQYTLGNAWDISTASFDSVYLDTSDQDSGTKAITFHPDGTKMYIGANNGLYQYTLSPAWDLSNATFDSVFLDATSESNGVAGASFNSDGTRLFLGCLNPDGVYQYTLSPAWDLSNATFDSITLDINAQTTTLLSSNFTNNGTSLYILGGVAPIKVYQYSLPYPLVITLPSALGNKKLINIKNIQTENFTIVAQSGELIDNVTQLDVTTQYESYTLESDGNDWIIV